MVAFVFRLIGLTEFSVPILLLRMRMD